MHPSTHDFEGLGKRNKTTADLERQALGLNLGDVDIVKIGRLYHAVELDGFAVRLELGSTKAASSKALKALSPKLLTKAEAKNTDAEDDVMVELYDRQRQEDLDPEQQEEFDSIFHSTTLHLGLVSATVPFQNWVH